MSWYQIIDTKTGNVVKDSRWKEMSLPDLVFLSEFEKIRDRFEPNSRERKLAEAIMQTTVEVGVKESETDFGNRLAGMLREVEES